MTTRATARTLIGRQRYGAVASAVVVMSLTSLGSPVVPIVSGPHDAVECGLVGESHRSRRQFRCGREERQRRPLRQSRRQRLQEVRQRQLAEVRQRELEQRAATHADAGNDRCVTHECKPGDHRSGAERLGGTRRRDATNEHVQPPAK